MRLRTLSRFSLLTILVFVLLCAASSSAAVHTAASCSRSDVQAAANLAGDGDVITVPAGSCTWTAEVDPPCTSWTLQGAGAGSTNITINNSGGSGLGMGCAGKSQRLTGFTFINQATSPQGTIYVSGGTTMSFRIDHNAFQDAGSWHRWLWIEGLCSAPGCVIDHNQITNQGAIVSGQVSSDTTGCVNATVAVDNCAGTTSWYRTMTFDNGNEVYWEDNTFTWNNFIDNDMLDCQNGGRYVFRHNTVTGNVIFDHGYDSVSNSCVEVTAYQNNMNVNNTDAAAAVLYRGGTGLVYQNLMYGTHYASYISLQNYRSDGGANTCATGRTNCNLCNGTNPIDGNQVGGWPCYQGPGRGSGSLHGLNSYPIYEWDNCGTALGCTGTSDQRKVGIVSGYAGNFKANQDWYDSVSAFNGTAGVGIGTLASRPSTCTAGVAYWSTDTSTLYQCSNTNTWSTYYRPYTYPHPLQGVTPAGAPAPPFNLTATVK